MADQPSSPEREDRANRDPTAGSPRWVKVSGIITLAPVLLLLILLLAGGNHGPGRHQSFRGYGGQLPSAATPAHDWGWPMALTPRLRKLALTTHVTASVGWLGAVIAFLALSVAGLTSQDPQTVQGAYLAVELTGGVVLVPLSLASLATGLVCSLGSAWGLFRHYWVLFKLVINVAATIVLLLYMQTLEHLGDVAAATTLPSTGLGGLRDPSPVVHAAAALLLLLVATTLAIYKPRGMTRYGQRTQHHTGNANSSYRNPGDSRRPAPAARGIPSGGLMVQPRKLVILAGAAAAAVAVLRHGRHAAQGHQASGGILIGDAVLYDALSRLLLGPFLARIAADVAAVAPEGARVLEVGCGPGHLSVQLAGQHRLEVTGLDLDPAMIARAQANTDRAANRGGRRPSFLVGDVAALAFPDGSFDLVVSTLSMHHWADPAAGLAEIGRVLRPNARALIWDFRPGVRPHLFGPRHAHLPDPVEHTRGSPLRVVNARPWRWPWMFALTQRIELVRADGSPASSSHRVTSA